MEEEKISRRSVLGAAVVAGVAGVTTKKDAKAASACLEAPDCSAICAYGGEPAGNGTQACKCYDNPAYNYAKVCKTGAYSDLKDTPKRALSPSNGGDASNTKLWRDYSVRLANDAGVTKIAVFSGTSLDYATKSNIATAPNVGSATYSNSAAGYTLSVSRDAYGRLNAVGMSYNASSANCKDCSNCSRCNCSYCDCNCCNCGDDSGCFISAELFTKEGYKRIEDIHVGDFLLGDDGEHRVVAIVNNTLGKNRFAISPLADRATILTNDHIINDKGSPIAYSFDDLQANKRIFESNGIRGTYNYQGLMETAYIEWDAFAELVMPADTKTYTFIVDKGHWGKTKGGTSVLLATQEEGL